jgi:PAS domain S-box-containing protein
VAATATPDSGSARRSSTRASERGADALGVALLATVYFATATVGLSLGAVGGVATSVWPPTGVSLAALVLFGYRLWPGVAIGALSANLAAGVPILGALGIAGGNTTEALLATCLLQRVGFRESLDRLRDVVALVTLAALASTTVSASVGVTSSWLVGKVPASDFSTAWFTWWLGDVMGDLVVAPALLLLGARLRARRRFLPPRWIEAMVLLSLLVLVASRVFTSSTVTNGFTYPLAYFVFPFVVWSALRFGQGVVAVANFTASAIAIWGTAKGLGPFTSATLHDSLLLLQMFMSVLTVTGLLLGAAVCERRRAIAELQAKEEELGDFVENAAQGLHWLGADGRILWANRADMELLGYSADEYLGRHIAEFHADPSVVEEFLQRLLHGETLHNYEARLRHKDGSIRHVLINANVLWRDGEFIHTRCFIRDVTERKQLEQQRAEFLAMLTHDIRNPASVIVPCAELLRETGPLTEEQEQIVVALEANADTVNSLVTNYLHLSRIESGQLILTKAPIDLPDLLFRVSKQYDALARQRHVTIALDLPASRRTSVYGDALALERVFMNLLHNAFKYTPQSGRVTVACAGNGDDSLTVTVRNTPIGGSESVLHGSAAAARPAPTGQPRDGTGLGLYIARSIIEAHGGTIVADYGAETSFAVMLPVQQCGEQAA